MAAASRKIAQKADRELAERLPFGCHGSLRLPAVDVDSYNVELRERRRFVGDRQRLQQVDRFIGLTRDGSAAERTLAYSVLAQSIRSSRTPEEVRERVAPVIEAAWGDAEAAARLVDAIGLMRLESQYEAQLQSRAAAGQGAAGGA